MAAAKAPKAALVLQEVKSGPLKPVYFFWGEEEFLRDQAYDALYARVMPPEAADFNFEVFYGPEVKGEEVVGAAASLPMMADRRLILVKEAGGLKERAWTRIASYLERPNPSSCLVFLADKYKVPAAAKKALEKCALVASFPQPYASQLPKYLQEEAARLKKKLSREAAVYLADMVGANLRALAQEVEKAALFAGDKTVIELEDVEAVVGDIKTQTVFELGDALGQQDAGEALRVLNKLLVGGTHELMILSMISRHFRRLLLARRLRDHGASTADVGQALGIPPYFQEKFFAQLKNFRVEDLVEVFALLLACDRALKGSKLPSELAMEELIIKICADRRRKPR